jgi:hypothetical protein
MTGTGAGTAIMIAVAAVLWFVYLVPTWVRRREYLATERTATRLQQTMRILAETSEVPDEVRIAATAREAARQERVLRAREHRADVIARHEAAAVRRSTPVAPAVPVSDRRRRMRRTRRMASVVMLAATIVGVVQVWLMTTTGAVAGSWFVLAGAFGAGALAISVQRRLDAIRIPERTVAAAPVVRRAPAASPVIEERTSPWTPIPIPAPLYLSRPPIERVAPTADTARLLREAAASAAEAIRRAEAEPEVVPFRAPAARQAPVSRYAAMGIVDPASVEAPDLDAVLRRRRAAG